MAENTKAYLSMALVRYNFLMKEVGVDYFKGATVIDLGSNLGLFADKLSKIGADVTCVEFRKEQLENIHTLFPHLKTLEFDLNKGVPLGHWDICTHMRLLHHMEDPDTALEAMSKIADNFILECGVLDSSDPWAIKYMPAKRRYNNPDKSRQRAFVSDAYIERVLAGLGLEYIRRDSAALNNTRTHYDWTPNETKKIIKGRSRFWLVSKT